MLNFEKLNFYKLDTKKRCSYILKEGLKESKFSNLKFICPKNIDFRVFSNKTRLKFVLKTKEMSIAVCGLLNFYNAMCGSFNFQNKNIEYEKGTENQKSIYLSVGEASNFFGMLKIIDKRLFALKLRRDDLTRLFESLKTWDTNKPFMENDRGGLRVCVGEVLQNRIYGVRHEYNVSNFLNIEEVPEQLSLSKKIPESLKKLGISELSLEGFVDLFMNAPLEKYGEIKDTLMKEVEKYLTKVNDELQFMAKKMQLSFELAEKEDRSKYKSEKEDKSSMMQHNFSSSSSSSSEDEGEEEEEVITKKKRKERRKSKCDGRKSIGFGRRSSSHVSSRSYGSRKTSKSSDTIRTKRSRKSSYNNERGPRKRKPLFCAKIGFLAEVKLYDIKNDDYNQKMVINFLNKRYALFFAKLLQKSLQKIIQGEFRYNGRNSIMSITAEKSALYNALKIFPQKLSKLAGTAQIMIGVISIKTKGKAEQPIKDREGSAELLRKNKKVPQEIENFNLLELGNFVDQIKKGVEELKKVSEELDQVNVKFSDFPQTFQPFSSQHSYGSGNKNKKKKKKKRRKGSSSSSSSNSFHQGSQGFSKKTFSFGHPHPQQGGMFFSGSNPQQPPMYPQHQMMYVNPQYNQPNPQQMQQQQQMRNQQYLPMMMNMMISQYPQKMIDSIIDGAASKKKKKKRKKKSSFDL